MRPTGGDDAREITTLLRQGARHLRLDGGTFSFSSTLSIDYSGVTIAGSGREVTTISVPSTYASDTITINSVVDCNISDLTIKSSSKRTAGNAIRTRGNSSITASPANKVTTCFIDNVNLEKQFNGLVYENGAAGATQPCWHTQASRMRILDLGAGGVGIWVNSDGGQNFFHDIEMYGDNTLSDGNRPLAGFRLQKCNDMLAYNVIAVYNRYGLLIDPPASGYVNATWFKFCDWDACTRQAVYVDATAAIIQSLSFFDMWASTFNQGSQLDAVSLNGNGTSLTGCVISGGRFNASRWGLAVSGVRNLTVKGAQCYGNTSGGMIMTGTTTDFQIADCQVYNSDGSAPAIGIQIDANCDHYSIHDNQLRTCTTKIQDNTAGPAANQRIIHDNITA